MQGNILDAIKNVHETFIGAWPHPTNETVSTNNELVLDDIQETTEDSSMWVLDGPDIGGLTSLQYNEMLAGIVYGVIDKNDATQIEACIADGKTEAVLGFTAFTELLSGHWLTAFETLGNVVINLPSLMGDCTTIQADVVELESWATVFLTPAELPSTIKSNVTHNLIKLTNDVRKAKNDWANEELFQFGAEIGTMLVIATQTDSVAEVASIVEEKVANEEPVAEEEVKAETFLQ